MAPRRKTWHLIIVLLRETIASFEAALREPSSLVQHPLRDSVPFQGVFYTKDPTVHAPPWREFVRQGVPSELEVLRSQSASGLVLLRSENRIFAVCFGHARHWLAEDSIVPNFGLRVVLNSVNPIRIRSFDLTRHEELTLLTRRQTSRGATLGSFGLDVARDIVRAIAGEPTDLGLAKRMAGADALAVSSDIGFSDLCTKCAGYLARYLSQDYKQGFGWVDQLSVVKGSTIIGGLNENLMTALKGAQEVRARLHLAPPEVVDWTAALGFRYATPADCDVEFEDLDVEDYLGCVENVADLALSDLKKRHSVKGFEAGDGTPRYRWPVLKCIVYETVLEGRLYVLTGGTWYEVSDDLVRQVDASLVSTPQAVVDMPLAHPGEGETAYNIRTGQERQAMAVLHSRLVYYGGNHSAIEPCDIFTSDRQFIHIKRRASSSTLSHLFAQGTVSAEAFEYDSVFRDGIRALLAEVKPELAHLIPADHPEVDAYEVVYAIVGKADPEWPASLPFFTKLHLTQAARQCSRLRVRCSLVLVPETPLTSPALEAE